VVWEQDVRVIVALTAEVERGLIKCHTYWNSGDYGPFKLTNLAGRRVPVNSTRPDRDPLSATRPRFIQRRATEPPTTGGERFPHPPEASGSPGDTPYITVRHFALSHSGFPFEPVREITQLQYSHWPDYGTTSQPLHLLELIEQCDIITRASCRSFGRQDEASTMQRPVLVHCSAGCGRTGTFCTVDSVLDMLKRQRAQGMARLPAGAQGTIGRRKSVDGGIYDGNVDLVATTVEDFRTQRPSMVQNLGQFVLCYESVLEWIVSQMDERLLCSS
jgi:tyrosine-protein phosphatase 2/3